MKIPRCRPNVYLKAAKLIDSDNEYYSCTAVYNTASKLGLISAQMHEVQYQCMFGPFINQTIGIKGDHVYHLSSYHPVKHPFWNKMRTEKRKEYRVLALLFMKAICENP